MQEILQCYYYLLFAEMGYGIFMLKIPYISVKFLSFILQNVIVISN